MRVVDTCPLQRFTLRRDPQSGQLQIRANFGHSMKVGFPKVSGTPSSIAHDDVTCTCTHLMGFDF